MTGMLLADLVATTEAVAATRSRLAKVAALTDLLTRLAPDEIVPAIGLLIGRPRQGRLGVGWRSIATAAAAPAQASTLTIGDVDAALEALAAAAGAGSARDRAALLRDLLARATAAEQGFLTRTILGDVRTGALEGIVTDAVAAASGAAPAVTRRAVMLSGDLGETARDHRTASERTPRIARDVGCGTEANTWCIRHVSGRIHWQTSFQERPGRPRVGPASHPAMRC